LAISANVFILFSGGGSSRGDIYDGRGDGFDNWFGGEKGFKMNRFPIVILGDGFGCKEGRNNANLEKKKNEYICEGCVHNLGRFCCFFASRQDGY